MTLTWPGLFPLKNKSRCTLWLGDGIYFLPFCQLVVVLQISGPVWWMFRFETHPDSFWLMSSQEKWICNIVVITLFRQRVDIWSMAEYLESWWSTQYSSSFITFSLSHCILSIQSHHVCSAVMLPSVAIVNHGMWHPVPVVEKMRATEGANTTWGEAWASAGKQKGIRRYNQQEIPLRCRAGNQHTHTRTHTHTRSPGMNMWMSIHTRAPLQSRMIQCW